MKLFQQLLVAPAALGLLATGANAAELNINGVSDYAASADQVTSVTQFSDVYPTDWAYQALANLVETYGCVAGYPNGTFRGNRAMTRYEAAALLNACLDRVTEVTDELKRLLKEFETELAILKGRVDGLEAKVGELEATQFSTTTKLKGVANWAFGAANFTDDQGSTLRAGDAQTENVFGANVYANDVYGSGTSFSYNLALNLETSFTGKDLLYTRLRSGNMGDTIYGPNGIFAQEYGFDSGAMGASDVVVNRLYYSFPVGDFTITGGPVVRQDDMLPVWPSAYPSDMTYDYFTYAGAPGAYNLALGGGVGITYTNDNWTFSTSYLSTNANSSCPDEDCVNGGGVLTEAAGGVSTTQIAYADDSWGVAAVATYASEMVGGTLYQGNATAKAAGATAVDNSMSYGLSAWWMPEEAGLIPSVSTGFGVSYINTDNLAVDDVDAELYSWYIGLEWDDVFTDGNSLGLAFGQPTWVGKVTGDDGALGNIEDTPGYAWELFYKFQVTDNITVTPAVTWLTKPFSNDTDLDDVDAVSAVIKTTFKF